MRFAIGKTRRTICTAMMAAIAVAATGSATDQSAFAEDRLGRGDRNADGADPQGGNQRLVVAKDAPPILREGTKLAATEGQIILLGRRWAFVPDTADESDRVAKQKTPQTFRLSSRPVISPATSAGSRSRSSRSNSDLANGSDAAIPPEKSSWNWGKGPENTRTEQARKLLGSISMVKTRNESDGNENASAHPKTQFLLTENLNLQRIVEAIRDDAADEKWVLTGEISEYFGENRLTIRTAQRSNHK
ncbi:hypothetical protein [Rubripirellula lacrimiformis]|nr:hypothetical protein [Rubripirellula lacrimiformis]